MARKRLAADRDVDLDSEESEMESSGSSVSESSASETDPEFVVELDRRREGESGSVFFDVTSRKPYRLPSELSKSFGGDDTQSSSSYEPSDLNEKVCNSCAPVLQKYSATFASFKALN